jgi:hypothetical protein
VTLTLRILERLARGPFSVRIEPGLSETEFAGIEERYGITFPPDLRELLAVGLPIDDGPVTQFSPLRGFPDWRNADVAILRERLGRVVEGVLDHVRSGHFWPTTWPAKPDSNESAAEIAARELAAVSPLVPVYGHRYIPSRPNESGNPIFSVVGSDAIYYGADLEDYFENEFFDKSNECHQKSHMTKPARHIPFWSDVAGPGWGEFVGP